MFKQKQITEEKYKEISLVNIISCFPGSHSHFFLLGLSDNCHLAAILEWIPLNYNLGFITRTRQKGVKSFWHLSTDHQDFYPNMARNTVPSQKNMCLDLHTKRTIYSTPFLDYMKTDSEDIKLNTTSSYLSLIFLARLDTTYIVFMLTWTFLSCISNYYFRCVK